MPSASPNPAIARLGLGTAQLGLDYGATNRTGQPGRETSRAILERACDAGIALYDTAPAYGNSEALVGEALAGAEKMRIVSKLPSLVGNVDAFVRDTVTGILGRLGRARLYGLLIHDPRDLAGPEGAALAEAMRAVQSEGLVEKIGASVYRSEEIDLLCAVMAPDIVQFPLNPLDQRAIQSGTVRRLKEAGTEIHARSIFLQGILLAPAASLPRHFAPVADKLVAFERAAEEAGISKLQACLAFALAQPEIDRIIVGVNALEELEEVLQAAGTQSQAGFAFARFACDDEAVLDPNRWPPRESLLTETAPERR